MELKSAVNILAYAAADGQIDEVIKLAIQTVLPYLETKLTANLQLNGEEWRDVCGYEGLYQVSNFGRVKSFHSGSAKLMTLTHMPDGYIKIALNKNGVKKQYSVHRLVAQAFLPNPDNLPQVDHINAKRFDNRVENLEWVTCSENIRREFVNGRKIIRGEEHVNSKLTNEQRDYVCNNPDKLTQKQLAEMFNVSVGCVRATKRNWRFRRK